MESCPTTEVKIFVGSRIGYSDRYADHNDLFKTCSEYCNEVGLCVTVTPTTYIYRNGEEKGYIIGLINYPRFPESERKILSHAFILASRMMKKMKQFRVTVMTEDRTYMLENKKND